MNSTRFARLPLPCICIFLHTLHSYRRSVFFDVFLPDIFHFPIAFLEYLPRFPVPRASPRFRARYFDPLVSGEAFLFFAAATLCSVCFLQNGQYLHWDLGIFIGRRSSRVFINVVVPPPYTLFISSALPLLTNAWTISPGRAAMSSGS